ncbi:MAG: hypothetical protein RSF79_29055, partial [Janthinobacterium sp.]
MQHTKNDRITLLSSYRFGYMAAADSLQKNPSAPVALPGLGRALISAGKISQQAAEAAVKKAATNKTPFITELS